MIEFDMDTYRKMRWDCFSDDEIISSFAFSGKCPTDQVLKSLFVQRLSILDLGEVRKSFERFNETGLPVGEFVKAYNPLRNSLNLYTCVLGPDIDSVYGWGRFWTQFLKIVKEFVNKDPDSPISCDDCLHKDAGCYTHKGESSSHCYYYRFLVKVRDRVCQECGSENRLTVHHQVRKTLDLRFMVLLCRKCHDEEHCIKQKDGYYEGRG